MNPAAKHPYKGPPKQFDDLPDTARAVCYALVDRLKVALTDTVHGIYLYGAIVFPETDHVVDLDIHVVLKRSLSKAQQATVQTIHSSLTNEYPSLTSDDLDIWYILLDDAGQSAPRHQVDPSLADTSWALHRAHLRAGYCIVLHGPAPRDVFPAPTWHDLQAALEAERYFIREHAGTHPAYCVLNACRLMVSHQTGDVVFSKKASAAWAMDRFPSWGNLIAAALREYADRGTAADRELLAAQSSLFLDFCQDEIGRIQRRLGAR